MRVSKLVPGTLRENPRDATIPSHQLLVRAGFIRQLAAGLYTYAHLGWRVIQKASRIVREEMDQAGAVEISLPILQPREIWDETKRWDVYSASRTFFTSRDRKGQDLALAPTAEEAVTALVRDNVTSWRQLPVNLYQIGAKFRDEVRPHGGIIRGREFLMKDAYSFDLDEAGMRKSYADMRDAYNRVFTRCGFNFVMVEADSGAIGGTGSAEFMVLAQTGEDFVVSCDQCSYGANQEKAVGLCTANDESVTMKDAHLEDTPNARTVEELSQMFSISGAQMVKTIIYWVDNTKAVAVCIRGDQVINETKLKNLLGATELELASDQIVIETTSAQVGFAGPIGLKCSIYFDETVKGLHNFLCGGNETDKHWLDVNVGRGDLAMPERFYNLRNAQVGDTCAACGQGKLGIQKGIEVGHIFQLGRKYSEAMNATYTDVNGTVQTIWMGCYGICFSRIMAAAIEQRQNYDNKGMIWPEALAPYKVAIISATSAQVAAAETLYQSLLRTGEVVLDDRDIRIGAKFADADLIGYPFQLIVGRRANEGIVEVKNRRTDERREMAFEEAIVQFSQR